MKILYAWFIMFLSVGMINASTFNYADVKIHTPKDIQFLNDNRVDVDRSSFKGYDLPEKVTVYVDKSGFEFLKSNGYSIKWLKNDRSKDCAVHTDDQIGEEMLALQNANPTICKRIQIGTSVQDRPIWCLKISDNIDVEENEPEFKYTSTMHGDEVVPMEFCISLMNDIVDGYNASNDTMTYIVNNTELYIIPDHNPDGTALHQRSNANGVDLNRHFPERTTGDVNSPDGKEPEMQAMYYFNEAHTFVLSANMHNGGTVVNYPWDKLPGSTAGLPNNYSDCPDDETFIWLSRGYAGLNTEMNGFDNGITNGAAWYQITGGMQDWNYNYYSDMEITLEVSDTKWPDDYSYIEQRWLHNRSSMLWYLMAVHKGIRGLVTDASTGGYLSATIKIEGIDKEFYTDPDVGDYHRIIAPGTYSMIVSADGYEDKMIPNIVVPEDDYAVNVDVALDLEGNDTTPPLAGELVGSSAQINSSLNIDIAMYDVSNISFVKAIYTINGIETTIDLTPSKDLTVYHFTGTIPAQAISTTGTVKFEAEDALGNNGISADYDITWINQIIEDYENDGFNTLSWDLSGAVNWTIADIAQSGAHSAKSGAISDDQSSIMEISMSCIDSDISFYYKVSSESTYDFLKFYIDGTVKGSWSGDISNWALTTYPVSSGNHTFKWEYIKDSGVSTGNDCAWVDYISFPSDQSGISLNMPLKSELNQNYPNPFNPSTTISYNLVNASRVSLVVYDVTGKEVTKLNNSYQTQGFHSVTFDAKNLASGIYYYSLKIGSQKMTKKMMLLK